MTSVAVFAPEMLPPLVIFAVPLRHWYDNGDVPEAATLNEADVPGQTVWLLGWPVTDGPEFTVSVALFEVAVPQALLTRQL